MSSGVWSLVAMYDVSKARLLIAGTLVKTKAKIKNL